MNCNMSDMCFWGQTFHILGCQVASFNTTDSYFNTAISTYTYIYVAILVEYYIMHIWSEVWQYLLNEFCTAICRSFMLTKVTNVIIPTVTNCKDFLGSNNPGSDFTSFLLVRGELPRMVSKASNHNCWVNSCAN
jgi:FlaA1/EpsC-like NDP-sugar epimerase